MYIILQNHKGLIDAPASQVKALLEMRIVCLKEERRNMDSLIEKAYELVMIEGNNS